MKIYYLQILNLYAHTHSPTISGTMSAEIQPAVTSSPSFAEVSGASPVSEVATEILC